MKTETPTTKRRQSATTTCSRSYRYPVDAQHSTVLGYGATSKVGAIYWAELDWRAIRKDGGQHMMNPAGGDYLHVRCKYNKDMDGPRPCPLDHRRWYRVRCAIAIGCRWRWGVVTDVTLHREKGGWVWEVTSSANSVLSQLEPE